jgi:hypothetical protein
VRCRWADADGTDGEFELAHTLTREDIEMVLKGGQLA